MKHYKRNKMKGFILASLLLLSLLGLSNCEDLYNLKSNVSPLNNFNFQKQINSQRIRDINMILFYKDVGMKGFSFWRIDARVIGIARKYEEFANEFKGIFRIFYINCDKEKKLCDTLKVSAMPFIRIFPPLPIPYFDVQIVMERINCVRARSLRLRSF